jgi:hypothetical protein
VLTQVSETANGYTVTFHEEQESPPYITFRATYVERTAWGIMTTLEVASPLAVQAATPNGLAYISRMNLMSGRDRQSVGQRLDAKLQAPRSGRKQDWEAHLERVAGLISVEMDKPVPHIQLEEAPLPERQRFVIPGLLAAGKTNVIFGPGGTGKSVLATRIAASVVSGSNLFGLMVHDPGEVLYLDWEDDSPTMVMRLDAVCQGMGIPRVPFRYKSLMGRGSYERHHADVKFYLDNNPTSLVIFDSVAMAMHGSSAGDGAEGAIRFFQLLNQLPATRLLIDHISSDDVKQDDKKGPPKKPYGSVFKGNAARNMWSVTPWNENAMTGLTLSHAKTNVGPKQRDIDVSVEWRDSMVTFVDL